MVYGLNEIVISEDAQERIDIGKLYYNVMTEDYTIFSEDCVLTEAFDFNKVKKVVKEKFSKLVEAVKKVLKSLTDSIKAAMQKAKDAFDDKKYEFLCNSMDKIFENKNSVTITAPEIAYNYSDLSFKILYDVVEKLNKATTEVARSKEILHADFIDDGESITDKISDIHNRLKEIQEKYESELEECNNVDIDSIFFKDKNPKEINITKKDAIGVCNSIYMKDMGEIKSIDANYKMCTDDIDSLYNNFVGIFESVRKCIDIFNGSEDETNSYATKFTNEYTSFLSNLQKKCYSTATSIYTRYVSAYKNYIKALSSTLRKILIAGHINTNSDNDKYIINGLDECIKDNDIKHIRNQLATLAYEDAGRQEPKKFIEKYIKYVQSKGMDPMEDFDNKDPLISKTKYNVNDDDYADAVYNLKKNFSKERLDDLDIIGKALYGIKRITRWN